MVTDNAIMNIKEVKHCEAEDAWVVVVGEEDDDVEDDNDGDDRDRDDDAGEAAFPNLPMVIFTFIPWLQWPKVPQVKYLVPGLSNLTTSLLVLKDWTGTLAA